MQRLSRRLLIGSGLSALCLPALRPPTAPAACCYFSAKEKDVLQPAQKAFITWDPDGKRESFTVQPKFEGDADDFGMVIPTPAQPTLDEMPRDFFKALAVFTILEPMDLNKYKIFPPAASAGLAAGAAEEDGPVRRRVKVLEAGVVGSLDYKVIQAEDARDLFEWLKENAYSYAGDEKALDFYIRKKWFFTVMKIDPKQMKKRPDGSYEGEVTPTRFSFESDRLVYPLKITQISVKDSTEALFYVQAPHKTDLPEHFSYQYSFTPMWAQATGFAVPEKLTAQEKDWQAHVMPRLEGLARRAQEIVQNKHQPAALEWAKKITQDDLGILTGERPYNRDAPKEDVDKLKLLKGHVRKGQFVTKLRKVFHKDEMNEDLVFVRATLDGRDDDVEYYSILPTSPP